MALSMLVGGAECGPSNPLQGLSKRFDQDRGIQQDFFGVGRAGSSREAFRTQQNSSDQDAARFFAQGQHSVPQSVEAAPYDFSALHATLPAPQSLACTQPSQQRHQAPNWATDFASQQEFANPLTASTSTSRGDASVLRPGPEVGFPLGTVQWNRAFPAYSMGNMMAPIPAAMPVQAPQQPIAQSSQISWEKAFSTHEFAFSSEPAAAVAEEQIRSAIIPVNHDELARTAGLLLENVKDEQNPKFKNSQFLSLMQQLRDRDVIVEGNQVVKNVDQVNSNMNFKGKSRAIDAGNTSTPTAYSIPLGVAGPHVNWSESARAELSALQESAGYDPNVAYFEQENADYMAHLAEAAASQRTSSEPVHDSESWGQLQNDWDQFEATASGIKPINIYHFQVNNPYMYGDASSTRHHRIYTSGSTLSLSETVLQLEAAVQRDMNNAHAWFELGVKQQENEREAKALQALQRAVELDPSHLPSWLALAISNTNEGNRRGTYDAVQQWVKKNEQYHAVSERYPEILNGSVNGRFGQLVECLIQMARSDTSGEVDPDIQIALAVLLNSDEEYGKAQDCFRTALAVRPDDWLLYNRVGATMANSGQAESALEYYYRALELNPGYIRARYNLGISCINLRRFEEAAHHILDALVLQDNDGIRDREGLNEKRGVTSKALWDSLKTTCLHMQRIDLATICDRQDLDAFKNTFNMSSM